MLSFLSRIGYVKDARLQNAYLENSLPGYYVSLFTLSTDLTGDLEQKLLSLKGIRIVPRKSRIYRTLAIDPLDIANILYEECCTRVYSSYSYHGVKGVEEQYDKILSG